MHDPNLHPVIVFVSDCKLRLLSVADSCLHDMSNPVRASCQCWSCCAVYRPPPPSDPFWKVTACGLIQTVFSQAAAPRLALKASSADLQAKMIASSFPRVCGAWGWLEPFLNFNAALRRFYVEAHLPPPPESPSVSRFNAAHISFSFLFLSPKRKETNQHFGVSCWSNQQSSVSNAAATNMFKSFAVASLEVFLLNAPFTNLFKCLHDKSACYG